MKHKSLILSCIIIFGLVFSAYAAYDITLEATSDGSTVPGSFAPGSDLYLSINLAPGSAGVAGCAFTLTYTPADSLIAPTTTPGNLPDSASSSLITSIFPFETKDEKITHCENASEAGKIMFAGAEIATNGGSKTHPTDITLFTVKFTVANGASGDINFELTPTTLNNSEAGWNGEAAPVIVGAMPNDATQATWPYTWKDGFGGSDLSDDFPVLLKDFSEVGGNPTLTVSTGITDLYATWKTTEGHNWAEPNAPIGGTTDDYDHDGFTNDQERLNGTDPTADNGNIADVDVTDSNTWTSVGTNYDATKDFRVSNLDIDDNGLVQLEYDAVLLNRRLAEKEAGMDFFGDGFEDGALSSSPPAKRTDPAALRAYIDAISDSVYDIDASGTPVLESDGVLIERRLAERDAGMDFFGDGFEDGAIDMEWAERRDPQDLRNYIDLLFPE